MNRLFSMQTLASKTRRSRGQILRSLAIAMVLATAPTDGQAQDFKLRRERIAEYFQQLRQRMPESEALRAAIELAEQAEGNPTRTETRTTPEKSDPDVKKSDATSTPGSNATPATAVENKKAITDFPRSFFHGGVRSVSPYRTTGDVDVANQAIALDRGKSDQRGYIEFQYTYDWAFNSFEPSESSTEARKSQWPLTQWFQDRFEPWEFVPKKDRIDFQFGAGFNFGDSSSNGYKDANASTIAGSGDFYLNGGVGYQLVRYSTNKWRFSVSPELSGGMTTDIDNFEVHPYAMPAMKIAIGFKPFDNAGNNLATILLRVGYAFMDVPNVVTLNGQPAVAVRDGRIVYNSMEGGPAVEAQLMYPIGDGTSLVAGGRIMEAGNADQWTFNIGLMISLDKISSLFGFSGTKTETL
jgi:hypothetical protein